MTQVLEESYLIEMS